MEKTPDTTGNYEVALANREMGIGSIPCRPGSKVPAVKWKQWQTRMPPEELLRAWFLGTKNNIAIVTNGLVVFDCDDPEKAALVLAHCGDTPHQLRTPRGGIHLGYRKRKGVLVQNLVKIKGQPIDIRTDGGLELIPNSATEDGAYEWVGEGLRPVAELPVARVGWTRERTRRQIQTAVIEGADRLSLLYRARRYLEKIEPAVSHQGGHNKTFSTACKLARLVGFDAELLWVLLVEYNQRCQPPWDEGALRHKWADALKRRA